MAALDAGAKRIVLGVGGSATVDGGAGILEALGARLLDADGQPLPRGGGALLRLSRIDVEPARSSARARYRSTSLATSTARCSASTVPRACLGRKKAQTRATWSSSKVVSRTLPRSWRAISAVTSRSYRRAAPRAASPRGCFGVLGARLLPGIDWVLDAVGFDHALAGATLCITAEGLVDRQSLRNKGPFGVAKRGSARGVPVVVLGGGIASDVTDRDFPAFAGMFSICARPMSLEQAMRDARPLLEAASERVVRLFARAHERGRRPDGATNAGSRVKA